MFHLHRWEEVGRCYQPSAIAKIASAPQYLFDRIVFGMTTVELRCTRCGLVRAAHYDGDSGIRRGD